MECVTAQKKELFMLIFGDETPLYAGFSTLLFLPLSWVQKVIILPDNSVTCT
jgi:hypothetical protein